MKIKLITFGLLSTFLMLALLIFGLDAALRINLAQYNKEIYNEYLELLKNPLIKNKEASFYIARNPIPLIFMRNIGGWVMPLTGTVYLSPDLDFKDRVCLVYIMAHELGHRELNHHLKWPGDFRNYEFEADFFALKLLGYDYIEYLSHFRPKKEKAIAAYKQYLREERPPFEYVSKSHYQICKSLEGSSLFTKKGTVFTLGSDPRVIGSFVKRDRADNIENIVYIELETLDSPHFKSSIAHELGHIQYNTLDHAAADRFACALVSRERVLAWLYSYQTNANVDQENLSQRIRALVKR